MSVTETQRTIDAVWRMESAKVIAGLTRLVGDVGIAEDLAQDALVVALEKWPTSGVPDNPGAWLMATAKHRAIDQLRRKAMLEEKHAQIGHDLEEQQQNAVPDIEESIDDYVGDDLLRLMFMCCHPVLQTDARVALTLRMLGGLTTPEIARAFLVPEATLAQRIVRAKRTLADAQVAFELPAKAELAERLSSVLDVIYLIFNEGYSATAGDDWIRPSMCDEALRLGRILAELVPDNAECTGSWRSWRFRLRGCARGSDRPVNPCCCSTRTALAGTSCSYGAVSERCSVRNCWAARWVLSRCRLRSPRVTRAPAPPKLPTGTGSQRSTTRLPRFPPRPSWS
jgi:RNA polymerase sigma factor (sigma-70 family)